MATNTTTTATTTAMVGVVGGVEIGMAAGAGDVGDQAPTHTRKSPSPSRETLRFLVGKGSHGRDKEWKLAENHDVWNIPVNWRSNPAQHRLVASDLA